VKILVTGGSGFIGSALVAQLCTRDHEVVNLDRRPPAAGAPEHRWVEGDVRDPQAWQSSVRGADAVAHLAGMVGLEADPADWPAYADHNDRGAAIGAAALVASGFSGRVVLASSMVVYGEGGWTCDEHGPVLPGPRRRSDLEAGRFEPPCPSCGEAVSPVPVMESAPTWPRNVYAATKLHQEHLFAVLSRTAGNPLTVLRYHNVYGPGMPRDTSYAGVASVFASALARGTAPRITEDGKQLRDFIHVDDVARATRLALTAAAPVPGVFNVASGRPRTVGEMARALWRSSGGAAATEPIVTGEFRLGDVRHVFASAERAADKLGFQARIDLESGLAGLGDDALPEPAVVGPR
jgi:dTDP-L-rhamnose 4-epimerase